LTVRVATPLPDKRGVGPAMFRIERRFDGRIIVRKGMKRRLFIARSINSTEAVIHRIKKPNEFQYAMRDVRW
jgi:hypothetical protein